MKYFAQIIFLEKIEDFSTKITLQTTIYNAIIVYEEEEILLEQNIIAVIWDFD